LQLYIIFKVCVQWLFIGVQINNVLFDDFINAVKSVCGHLLDFDAKAKAVAHQCFQDLCVAGRFFFVLKLATNSHEWELKNHVQVSLIGFVVGFGE
jgi:hypothetical protein